MVIAIGAALVVVSASTGEACLESIDSGARTVPLLRCGLSAVSASASSASSPVMGGMMGAEDTARQGLVAKGPGGDAGLAMPSSVSQEDMVPLGGTAASGLRRFKGKNLRAPALALGPILSPELP